MNDLYNPTCETCLSFHGPGEGETTGTCWRYPPTPLSIPVPAPATAIQTAPGGPGGPTRGVMTLPVRPPVGADTLACGEWDDGSAGNLIDDESDAPGDGA